MRLRPNILKQLLNEREKVKNETHAHRSCLARNGNIICSGNNNFNSKYKSNHAEPTAMAKAGNAKKYDIYITRTGKGEWGGNSRPCLHCLQAMLDKGNIRHVIYSDGETYQVSTVNKLLREPCQHISAGNRHLAGEDNHGEDDDGEGKKEDLICL